MHGYSDATRAALQGFYDEVRTGVKQHVTLAGGILKTIMKRKAKAEALAWVGDVLKANGRRGGM